MKVGNVNEEYITQNQDFKKIVDTEVLKESAVSVKDLAIGGKDLIDLGIDRGPMFGVILNGLLDRVVEDPELNDRDTLLDLVGAV